MANLNWDQNNNNEENRWQEPSAEPRKPQLNGTICGCDCRVRGFVVGDGEGGGRGDDEDTDRVWLDGDEGVNMHMVADLGMLSDTASQQSAPELYDPFTIPTAFGEYEFGRQGLVLQQSAIAERFDVEMDGWSLARINSNESLMMHAASSEPSVVSPGYVSARAESPTQLVFGIGDWSHPPHNARSGYFFITLPLPLVAPLRCACHAETGTESEDNSSADLFTDGSDYLEDAGDDDSSE